MIIAVNFFQFNRILIDLAPHVWLHSSVGRVSHRYRAGHGFSFFRLLPSNCLNWKSFTSMIILLFHLQAQYNMNFVYISQFWFLFFIFGFCFSLFKHYACHTVVRFCCEGLQGTFPARADSLPQNFWTFSSLGTWFLSATKTKKSLPKLNEIFLVVKST